MGIKRKLVDSADIEQRIRELGTEISRDYEDKNPVVVGVLKGSIPFFGRLETHITGDVEFDFISAYSYSGERTSSGIVRINKDLDTDIEGRHVLLVDDVLDTAETLRFIINFLKQHKPKSIELCVMAKKDMPRKIHIEPRYVAFTVPNVFLVGFGLDYQGLYRNLPYIAEFVE